MHDRIRLALSAAGIAAVTLLASGHPLPSIAIGHAEQAPAVTAPVVAAEAVKVAPVSDEIPVAAPKAEQPEFHAPRIRRTAGADLTQA